MSVFQFLELQPIDPQDDGSISELDQYTPDETIDLSGDVDGEALLHDWEMIEQDLALESLASAKNSPHH